MSIQLSDYNKIRDLCGNSK